MTAFGNKSRFSLGFLAALALLAALLTAWIVQPFLEAIFLAVILAFTFQSLHTIVRRKVGNDSLASLATLLFVIVLVLLPMVLVGVKVSTESVALVKELNARAADQGGIGRALTDLAQGPIQWAARNTGIPAAELQGQAVERLQSIAGAMLGWAGSVATHITSALGTIAIALVTLFFLLAGGTAIRESFYRWLPLGPERLDELLAVLGDSIVANVYAIAAVGLAQGSLISIGFFIAGLPSPLLWGLIAGVMSLIPIVGSGFVWIPAVVVLFVQGTYGKGIFLLAWGALIVASADNVVRPWVLAGRTNMNTLVLLFALLGGVQAFGFMGLFAGPVIVSVTASLFRILREEIEGAGSPPQ